jgi:hypothetical protein
MFVQFFRALAGYQPLHIRRSFPAYDTLEVVTVQAIGPEGSKARLDKGLGVWRYQLSAACIRNQLHSIHLTGPTEGTRFLQPRIVSIVPDQLKGTRCHGMLILPVIIDSKGVSGSPYHYFP